MPPHVMICALENHSYTQVIGNSNFPHITALAAAYGNCTNYFAVTHQSLPNYMAIWSGDDQCVEDSFVPGAGLAGATLADSLDAAGIGWKHYAENLPSAGYIGPDSGGFVQHHCPSAYFKSFIGNTTAYKQAHLVNYTNLTTDLTAGTVPPFVFIQPNNAHNGHTDPTNSSDGWVQGFVTLVQGSSWYAAGGMIILWYDESHPDTDNAGIGDKGCASAYPGGGKTVCIVISAANASIAPMTSNINSYGILRGIEKLYGLPFLLKSAHTIDGDLSPLLGVGVSPPPPPPPPPPPAGFTVTPTALNYTATVGGGNPANQNLTLHNTSSSVSGTWALVFSGGSWLSAASTSGTLNAGISFVDAVSVSITGLTANTYTETATFTFTPSSGAPIVVPVTVTLFLSTTPPPPPPPPPPATVSNLGNGFTLTAPADTTPRTLEVYCDVDRGTATFAASLSDGSVPDFYDSSLSNMSGVSAGQYALSYQAGSPGKLLSVTYVLEKGLTTGVGVSSDTYNRANQSGLGTASDGETYSLVSENGTPAWSIVGNAGQMAGSAASSGIALLGTHTLQDGEVLGIVNLSNLANSGGLVMRATAGAASYYAAVLTGSTIQLIYMTGGDAIVLTSQPATLKVTTSYLLRFRIAKNCLWARYWPNDGSSEPKKWSAFKVDSHLTQAGLSGLRGSIATSSDTVLFDTYSTLDLSTPGDPSSVSLYSAALAGAPMNSPGTLPGQVFVNGVSNYIFGTNMSTDFAATTVRNTPAIQSQIKAAGFTIMRCAIPNGSSNAYIDLTAAACNACGTVMLVILSDTDNVWNQSLVTYLGSRCLLYEFGNEPDLAIAGATYLANWNSFIPVLRALNTGAAFIGPALGVFANVNTYLVPWLQGCVTSGVMPSAISYHVYPCTSSTCDQTCCTPLSGNFARDAATLRAAIATVTPLSLPICLTEWNIDASNPQKAYTQQNPFNTTWTEAAMESMVAGHLDMACQWDAAGNAGGGTDDLISTQSPYPQQVQYAPMVVEIAKYLGNSSPPPANGSLAVTSTTPTGSINLTLETGDWAHWGYPGAFAYEHKAGVTPTISNFTEIGSSAMSQDTATPITYVWTDGTPDGSVTTTTGCTVVGVANGFYLTAPADTTSRTLVLYVEAKLAQGQLTATLSDGSAAAFIDSSLNDTGGGGSMLRYVIVYNAASLSQTLTVQWTMLMDYGVASGLTTYSSDTMTRANQTNWGTSSGGETWTKTDVVGTTAASIVSNMGQVTASSGSPSEVALLGTQVQANAESYVEWEVSSILDQPSLVLRATATNTFYRACVTGGNTLELDRNVAGAVNMLKNTGVAISPNTLYAMRFRINGSNYYVKHWLKSGSEPAGWSITGTDSGATAITGAGQWGIRTRVNAPSDTIKYQNFSVTNFGTGGGGSAGSIGLHAATAPSVVVSPPPPGPPPPPPPPPLPPPPGPPPAPVVAIVVNATDASSQPFKGFGVQQDAYNGSWLHVANGQIVNDAGKPVFLRGLNTAGLEYGNGTAGFTQARINAFASNFSMNLWRVCINVSWWNNNVLMPDGITHYKDWIQTVIGWMKAAGNYVEIDPTNYCTIPPQQSGQQCSDLGNPPYSTSDMFNRANATSTWGTASSGKVWVQKAGLSSYLSLSSGEGVISTGVFDFVDMILGTETIADTEALVRLAINDPTNNPFAGILLRYTDENTYYWAQINGGHTWLGKLVAGANTTLANSALTHTSGQFYWMRFNVTGTTLKVKTWPDDGSPEPGSWEITVTDSALTSGYMGLTASSSVSPNGAQFDTFTAGTPVTACITSQDTQNNPPWTDAQKLTATTAFFSDFIANYYPSDPAILFDSLNEPTGFADQYSANGTVIAAIRALQPHSLIFIYSASLAGIYAGAEPDYPEPDLVWDYHLYDDYPSNTWQNKIINNEASGWPFAQAHNRGVSIGEWNANITNDPGGFAAAIASLATTSGFATTYYQAGNVLSGDNVTVTAEGLLVQTPAFGAIATAEAEVAPASGTGVSSGPASPISPTQRALINSRLAFMNPPIIRTAATSVAWWCPTGVVGTYDFTNALMQEWYAVFENAQAQGIDVIVSVNSPAPFTLLSSGWCTAFADLIDHLVNTRGYTCITYVSGLSEPDTF